MPLSEINLFFSELKKDASYVRTAKSLSLNLLLELERDLGPLNALENILCGALITFQI
jgi:hypothetical protein